MTGAWRATTEPFSISSDEISTIAPLLLETGAGALAWRRMQSHIPPETPPFVYFREAYRKHSIEAALHEMNIVDVLGRVRAAGVEPILFKGWSLARLYPDDGLRPYGDIDLWVRSEDLNNLNTVLSSRNGQTYCVEAHVSFYPQFQRSFEDVLRHSQLVPLRDLEVRIPSDEDHLRFICLHFLFHGGWRPLWLCDIALMVESAGAEFDWDRCLSGNRKYADWIACAIGLAHQLLGAEISGTPVTKRARALPEWLRTAVLRQWAKGRGMSFAENLSFSLPRRLTKPLALGRALSEHWRNPIQASVEMDAWFSRSPRAVLQFGSALRRVPQFARYFGREPRRA